MHQSAWWMITGLMLSPILWTLAISVLLFSDTLEINTLSLEFGIESISRCDETNATLQRFLGEYFDIMLRNMNVSCMNDTSIEYNISVTLQTYTYSINEYFKNDSSFMINLPSFVSSVHAIR